MGGYFDETASSNGVYESATKAGQRTSSNVRRGVYKIIHFTWMINVVSIVVRKLVNRNVSVVVIKLVITNTYLSL